MPQRALDRRLNQRSRRSGVMIGLSMAAAIVVLVVGFSVVYTAIDPLVSDFVSDVEPGIAANVDSPSATRTDPTAPADDPPAVAVEPTQQADSDSDPARILGNTTATEPPAAEPTASPDATDGDFNADYRVTQRINLRSGPGTSNSVVRVLETGTDLQRIGDDGSPDGTAPDDRWLEFRTEDGDEGWIREIDVAEAP